MIWKLLLLFTLVPMAELALLIELGRVTSTAFAILLCVVTAVVGATLARIQGLATLRRITEELDRGHLPGDSVLDGLLILIAGALLVTPGLLTDAVGFALLTPPGRALARRAVKGWLRRKIDRGRASFYADMGFRPLREEPPPGSPPLEDEGRKD